MPRHEKSIWRQLAGELPAPRGRVESEERPVSFQGASEEDDELLVGLRQVRARVGGDAGKQDQGVRLPGVRQEGEGRAVQEIRGHEKEGK